MSREKVVEKPGSKGRVKTCVKSWKVEEEERAMKMQDGKEVE